MPDSIPELPQKAVKEDTKQKSLDLWRSGLSIDEIAGERNLAVSTIEGHLAHYVGTGEIGLDHFVNPARAALIADFFRQHDDDTLKSAQEALGNDITYSELRYVLKHLESQGKKKAGEHQAAEKHIQVKKN